MRRDFKFVQVCALHHSSTRSETLLREFRGQRFWRRTTDGGVDQTPVRLSRAAAGLWLLDAFEAVQVDEQYSRTACRPRSGGRVQYKQLRRLYTKRFPWPLGHTSVYSSRRGRYFTTTDRVDLDGQRIDPDVVAVEEVSRGDAARALLILFDDLKPEELTEANERFAAGCRKAVAQIRREMFHVADPASPLARPDEEQFDDWTLRILTHGGRPDGR